MTRRPHPPDLVGEYMTAARARLAADGNELSETTRVYGHAIVAVQSSIHLLGKADLFTVIVPVTKPVTTDLFAAFIGDATLHAQLNRRGNFMNRGLAVLPILVTHQVSPEVKADALARKPSKVGMGRYNGGTFRWPAVVDVSTDEHLYYSGRFWIGRFGSEWIWEKLLLAMGPHRPA